jgi:hypothetical protein
LAPAPLCLPRVFLTRNPHRGKSTRSGDTQLERWLVINDVLIAAGWPGGVFDAATRVVNLLQSRSPDEWNSQDNASERERSEKVVKALKGVQAAGRPVRCTTYTVSMQRLQSIINSLQGRTQHMSLTLKNLAAEGETDQWAVTRTGVLWDMLQTCPEPEWQAFFAGHWESARGFYAPVDGVKPPPRI